MPEPVDALILDLLEWVGPSPRPCDEVMEAWRTSCPRLPVWEDANARGFIQRHSEPGQGSLVSVSPAGAAHLRRGRAPPPAEDAGAIRAGQTNQEPISSRGIRRDAQGSRSWSDGFAPFGRPRPRSAC